MSVLVVETWVVRAEKLDDFEPALQEFVDYKDGHPEVFEGVRSWRLWKQEFGGVSDMYIEMWEYENLTEMERIDRQVFADEGMKKVAKGFHQLVEPATFSASIWYPVV